MQALGQGVPPLAVVESEPCKHAAVTKEGKKGALKAQQPEQGLKIATPQGQDAPLLADVPQESCQGATLKKAPKAPKVPKVPKEAQPTKHGLKIATPAGQDSPLLSDVPLEPCQDASLKKASAPKEGLNLVKELGTLKAQKSSQLKEMSGTVGTQLGAPKAPKAPKEDQQTKQDLIVFDGSGSLKVQKSGQAKKVNKRKAKADVKEKGDMTVPEQHNVKRLKRMKEVGVPEVAFEQKLAIDEGTRARGQLEKVSEVKIALKRDVMKKKVKKHVEKGLEDEGSADKALVLVGSSKRPMLQRIEERAKNRAALTWDVLPRKAQKAMRKDTLIMEFLVNHMKMVDQREEAMKKEIKGHVEEGYKSRQRGSSRGSDDGGDEDDGSSQDGSGDDDSDDGSDGDADDDDGGSDISGGSDDKADNDDDGTNDKDDGSGSGKGDSESVSEQDGTQDVSSGEDEVHMILSSPTGILA
ncbi:hypothetical protein L7F22_053273 [Adiantum nelumboides]|nr:hypothetical protein [Adiantum nelumboides]